MGNFSTLTHRETQTHRERERDGDTYQHKRQIQCHADFSFKNIYSELQARENVIDTMKYRHEVNKCCS